MEEAGPLNGKTPPILISVRVTPGISPAHAYVVAANSNAEASLMPGNILLPPTECSLRSYGGQQLKFFFRTVKNNRLCAASVRWPYRRRGDYQKVPALSISPAASVTISASCSECR